MYQGPAKDDAERLRQSIVLEAPDGALLRFDKPFNIKPNDGGGFGRLQSGLLRNEVRIRSDGKDPGPEDDLLIVGRDIRLTENTISTEKPVEFHRGPHFGRGRDLFIKLLTGAPSPDMESAGPKIEGIEFLELKHVEQIHLDVNPASMSKGGGGFADNLSQAASGRGGAIQQGDSPIFPAEKLGQSPTAGQSPATVKSGPVANIPIEIHCNGPFRFDVVHRVATFRDHVNVTKMNPVGPPDRIDSELLSIFFSDRKPGKPADPNAGSLDLTAKRLEAWGNPVVISAPSMKNLFAQGRRVEYNLEDESIALEGNAPQPGQPAQEAFLQQGPDEIHAQSIFYKSAGPGRLGRVYAKGPGLIRGQSPKEPNKRLEAAWQGVLRIDPSEQNQHILSMTGGSRLTLIGLGEIQAPEIFFWLQELPPEAEGKDSQLRPFRMVARNDVHLNSPELYCNVEELIVRFKEGAAEQKAGAVGLDTGFQNAGSGPVASQFNVVPVGAIDRLPPTNPAAPPQHYEIVGRRLTADVVLGAQQEKALSNLNIEGPRVTFQGGGMNVIGTNIHFDREMKLLRIDGEGEMELPIPSDAHGKNGRFRRAEDPLAQGHDLRRAYGPVSGQRRSRHRPPAAMHRNDDRQAPPPRRFFAHQLPGQAGSRRNPLPRRRLDGIPRVRPTAATRLVQPDALHRSGH